MPSSPKSSSKSSSSSYYGRQAVAFSSRRSAVIIVLSAVLVGFLVGVAFLRPIWGSRCLSPRPRSVRVVWEHGGGGGGSHGVGNRHKVMGFVGVQTGFGSVSRRASLRKTWFPSDRQGLERY